MIQAPRFGWSVEDIFSHAAGTHHPPISLLLPHSPQRPDPSNGRCGAEFGVPSTCPSTALPFDGQYGHRSKRNTGTTGFGLFSLLTNMFSGGHSHILATRVYVVTISQVQNKPRPTNHANIPPSKHRSKQTCSKKGLIALNETYVLFILSWRSHSLTPQPPL